MVIKYVLILFVILTIILSGLFSGAETGIYRLSRLRLRLGIEKKRLSFILLGKAMHDRTRLLLSILVGNNLTHYIITSIITYLLWKGLTNNVEAAYTVELIATLITAPILLIFAELIPKNIFFYRADSLMPIFSPFIFIFHKVFTYSGIVPLLRFLSGLFNRLTGSFVADKVRVTTGQRHHIKTIISDSREEAILSTEQTNIITRLVDISDIRIGSIMTPISRVKIISVNSTKSDLLKVLKEHDFTRLLVTDNQSLNITGFINIYEALSSSQEFTDVRNFIQPIQLLHDDTTVIDAINFMRKNNHKMVLVVRASRAGQQKPVGIVTMKDLVEELVGELTEW